jgi:acetyltransferase-like isoleucine patch superfamily enzyme
VNFPCHFTKNTIIGNNCHFNGMQVNGNGEVHFGNNFHSGKECQIFTSYHNYDFGVAIPYDNTFIDKNVIIEDNVWLGTRVIILGGISLGEGCVIQAGSVVVNNIPKCAIAGGAPAKIFKMRDIEHYEKLKSEKAFL